MKRRSTKQVKIGEIYIGSEYPVFGTIYVKYRYDEYGGLRGTSDTGLLRRRKVGEDYGSRGEGG